MTGRLQARVGRLNNHADRLLIKALESALALKVLKMAADRSVPGKLIELLLVNQATLQQPVGALGLNRPPFPLRECLLQERKIGERLHRVDTLGSQLVTKQLVIETAFEMMQAGIENTLAMQAHPKTDCAKLL